LGNKKTVYLYIDKKIMKITEHIQLVLNTSREVLTQGILSVWAIANYGFSIEDNQPKNIDGTKMS